MPRITVDISFGEESTAFLSHKMPCEENIVRYISSIDDEEPDYRLCKSLTSHLLMMERDMRDHLNKCKSCKGNSNAI